MSLWESESGVNDADDLSSGAATDGYVLTADGSGGAAWEAVPAVDSTSLILLTALAFGAL